MLTSGADAGRFADKNAFSPDASNGFGQALGLLALQRTTDGVPAAATTFLLAQQCPAGGFRLFYDTGSTLRERRRGRHRRDVARGRGAARGAADRGGLGRERQGCDVAARAAGRDDGVVLRHRADREPQHQQHRPRGRGPAHGRRDSAADKGAAYVEGLQLASGADDGALAYDHDAFVAAPGGVIDDLSRDQWRRATAQAVLALGLPGYGSIVAVPAPTGGGGGGGGPVVGGTSKATVSVSSPHAGDRVRLTGGGFRPGESVQLWLHSTPRLLATVRASSAGSVTATVRIPASTSTGRHVLVALGAASGHQATVTVTVRAVVVAAPAVTGGATLPDTGARTVVPAATGVALLLLGALLMGLARSSRRTPVIPR